MFPAPDLYVATVAFSILGAFTNLLMKYRSPHQWLRYQTVRTLIAGAIAGVLYAEMRAQYGLPDSVVSFVVGHAGLDYLNFIIEKLRPNGGGNK